MVIIAFLILFKIATSIKVNVCSKPVFYFDFTNCPEALDPPPNYLCENQGIFPDGLYEINEEVLDKQVCEGALFQGRWSSSSLKAFQLFKTTDVLIFEYFQLVFKVNSTNIIVYDTETESYERANFQVPINITISLFISIQPTELQRIYVYVGPNLAMTFEFAVYYVNALFQLEVGCISKLVAWNVTLRSSLTDLSKITIDTEACMLIDAILDTTAYYIIGGLIGFAILGISLVILMICCIIVARNSRRFTILSTSNKGIEHRELLDNYKEDDDDDDDDEE